MSILWITLNLLDLWSFLILIFANVWFEDNRPTTSIEEFGQATAMINPVAIAQFFEAIYTDIFKCLLATRSIKSGLLKPVLIYFGAIKINSWGMLYLHCLA